MFHVWNICISIHILMHPKSFIKWNCPFLRSVNYSIKIIFWAGCGGMCLKSQNPEGSSQISVSLRSAWSTWSSRPAGLHNETLSQKKKKRLLNMPDGNYLWWCLMQWFGLHLRTSVFVTTTVWEMQLTLVDTRNATELKDCCPFLRRYGQISARPGLGTDNRPNTQFCPTAIPSVSLWRFQEYEWEVA